MLELAPEGIDRGTVTVERESSAEAIENWPASMPWSTACPMCNGSSPVFCALTGRDRRALRNVAQVQVFVVDADGDGAAATLLRRGSSGC